MLRVSKVVEDYAKARPPAIPERCPRCDSTERNAEPRKFWSGIVRSPIRGHMTGATRVAQIVVDRVVRAIGDGDADGRTIVFTDSRDDAANTAAGMELNHFRDLLRQLVTQQLKSALSPDEVLRRAASGEQLEGRAAELANALKKQHPNLWAAYRLVQRLGDDADAEDVDLVDRFEDENRGQGDRVSWGTLRQQSTEELVRLGVNPAGPLPSGAGVAGRHPWRALHDPPNGEWAPLAVEQRGAGAAATEALLDGYLADALFNRGGRDFESIGLGWLEPRHPKTGTLPLPAPAAAEVVRSAIRILGLAARRPGGWAADAKNPGRDFNRYLAALAKRHNLDLGPLKEGLEQALEASGCLKEWCLALEGLTIVKARAGQAAWHDWRPVGQVDRAPRPDLCRARCRHLHDPRVPARRRRALHGRGPRSVWCRDRRGC